MIREEWRRLIHSPFAHAARFCVIGAATAVAAAAFTVLSAAVLRPLPYPGADRTFGVWDAEDPERRMLSHDLVQRLRAIGGPVRDAASYATADFTTATENIGPSGTLHGLLVSARLLPILGGNPIRGSSFSAGDFEPGAEPVVLVSDRLRALYPDIQLGSLLSLNGVRYRVLGIMRADFVFPGRDVVLWVPLQLLPASGWSGRALVQMSSADDPTMTLNSLVSGMGSQVDLRTRPLRQVLVGQVTSQIWSLQVAAAALLIVAIAAAAYGFFADAWERRHTYSLRGALGASRSRLALQYGWSVGLFAALAATIGAFFSAVIMAFVFNEWNSYLPHATATFGLSSVTSGVLLAFAATTLASLPGLLTVLRAGTTVDLRSALHVARPSLGHRAAMLIEAALVFGLCVTAVWCGLALRGLLGANVGFQRSDFVFTRMTNPDSVAANVTALADRILQLQHALESSGIRAGVTSVLPLSDRDHLVSVRFLNGGSPTRDYSMVRIRVVTKRFFEVTGVPCVAGVCLDRPSGFGVTVNEAFRRRFFADGSALAAPIHFGGRQWTITGVVASVAHETLVEEPAPEVFVDYAQVGGLGATTAQAVAKQVFLVFERREDTWSDIARTQAVVADLFPESRLDSPTLFSDIVHAAAAYRPLLVACAVLFACVGALILFANFNALVARELVVRRRDFAIRQAVGGTPGVIVRCHFKKDALFVGTGCAIGSALAWWAVQGLRARLFVPESLDAPHVLSVALMGSLSCAVLIVAMVFFQTRQLRVSNISQVLRV